MHKKFSGLIAAVHTPMYPDGSLNLGQIGPIVEHLVSHGIVGAYALGSTGEGQSLTIAERKDVAVAYLSAASGRLPVLVQVGHNCLADARELAQHAEKHGATAISATLPSYFKPSSTEMMVDCLGEIADAASSLPFYFYYIPSLVNVSVDLVDLMQLAAQRIPQFAGIKYTSPTLWEFQRCLEVDPDRFECLFGLDEMLLPAVSVGATGAIGSTFNFAAPIYHRVLAAACQDDWNTARQIFSRAVAMISVLHKYGGFPAIKAMMSFIGLECGPVRKPQQAISHRDLQRLRQTMEEAEILPMLSLVN